MWRLFIFLILLVASVFLGIQFSRHPGFLLIVYHPWMVQMPLWFVVVGLVVVFVLFYLCIDSFDRLQFMFYRLQNWMYSRKSKQTYSQTQQGLAALVEGRWKKAEKKLINASEAAPDPLINYLSAAKAAQAQGAVARRDDYIKLAYQKVPRAEIAIGLTQAELEMEKHQYEHAKATLNHLRELNPKHPRVLKLLETIYARTGDWQQLQALLPALKKAKLINKSEAEQFEKNLYIQLLNTDHSMHAESLEAVWHKVPRYLQKQPAVIYPYVKQLMRFKDTAQEVENKIRQAMKQQYHDDLVNLYGQLSFTNLNRQLVLVNAWMKRYGEHPALLLLLGKLCMQLRLWGKAKEYFIKTLSYGPNPEASMLYGRLLVQLGEHDTALQVYQEALVGHV